MDLHQQVCKQHIDALVDAKRVINRNYGDPFDRIVAVFRCMPKLADMYKILAQAGKDEQIEKLMKICVWWKDICKIDDPADIVDYIQEVICNSKIQFADFLRDDIGEFDIEKLKDPIPVSDDEAYKNNRYDLPVFNCAVEAEDGKIIYDIEPENIYQACMVSGAWLYRAYEHMTDKLQIYAAFTLKIEQSQAQFDFNTQAVTKVYERNLST